MNIDLKFSKFIEILTLTLVICIFATILFLLASNFKNGFDITDESYYILSASQPNESPIAISQFGYYTGILYELANNDISLFRLSGLSILLLTSLIFSLSIQTYWKNFIDDNQSKLAEYTAIVVISTCSLAYYCRWLITPSYNWLALIGVIITSIGLLNIAIITYKEKQHPRIYFHSILIGIGGTLAFFAKQPTAALLAIICLFWLFATANKYLASKIILLSSITSILLITSHILIFHDSFFNYFTKLKNGLEIGDIIVSTDYILKVRTIESLSKFPYELWKITLNGPIGIIFIMFFITALAYQLIPNLNKITNKHKTLSTVFIILISFTWYIMWTHGRWSGYPRNIFGVTALNFTFILLVGCMIIYLSCSKQKNINTRKNIHFSKLILLLLFLSFAAPIMSGMDLRKQLFMSFIFLGSIILYSVKYIRLYFNNNAIFIITSILLTTTVLVSITHVLKQPYRLIESIDMQNIPVTFLNNNQAIRVDKKTSSYVNNLKLVALSGDWETKTPLIDLTGASPGAVVILDGIAPGTPWLLGGYKRSPEYVEKVLSVVEAEKISKAWVLTSHNGKRSVPDSILKNLGLSFPEDYTALGQVTTAHRNEKQTLWKPKTAN